MKFIFDILDKRNPSLALELSDIGLPDLPKEKLSEIIDCLIEEFVETGLLDSSEPNERGLIIEDLIDIVNSKLLKGTSNN